MITILALWLLLIITEICRNYDIIVKDRRRPVYWKSTVYRISAGFLFWVASPFLWKTMTWWQWWAMIPMMLLSFWFLFDYGLNLARNKKPYYYLNPEGSILDKLQCNYPNTYTWFWWKLMLMITGVMIFYYGLDYIWNGT